MKNNFWEITYHVLGYWNWFAEINDSTPLNKVSAPFRSCLFIYPYLFLSIYHVKKTFNHIKSLVVICSVSPRWRSQGTLYFACLSIVQSCQLYEHIYTCKGRCIGNLMDFISSWIFFHRTNTIRNLFMYLSISSSNKIKRTSLFLYPTIYLTIYLCI